MAAAFPSGVNPAEIPVAPPPPGLITNLHDPETLEGVTITISVLMIILTFLSVAARLYSTVLVTRNTSIADYSCLLAVMLLYGYIGMVFHLNKYARHTWDLPAIWVDAEYFKGRLARDMLFSPATFFAKCSILLLYLRIFAPKKWLRCTIWWTIVFMFGVYWCYVGVNVGLCAPPPGKSWLSRDSLTKCEKQETYAIIQGASNVAIDILILVLPLPIVWKLQLPRSKRVGVLAVFSSGTIALAASLISMVYRIKLDAATDTFWIGAIIFVAIIVEVSVTIICSCAPAIFALGRHLHTSQTAFPRSWLRSRTTRTSTTRNSASNNRPSNRENYEYNQQPALDSRTALKEYGYLELGEVAQLEHRLQSAELEIPPPVPVSLSGQSGGVMRQVDMDVSHSEGKVRENPKVWPKKSFEWGTNNPRG